MNLMASSGECIYLAIRIIILTNRMVFDAVRLIRERHNLRCRKRRNTDITSPHPFSEKKLFQLTNKTCPCFLLSFIFFVWSPKLYISASCWLAFCFFRSRILVVVSRGTTSDIDATRRGLLAGFSRRLPVMIICVCRRVCVCVCVHRQFCLFGGWWSSICGGFKDIRLML